MRRASRLLALLGSALVAGTGIAQETSKLPDFDAKSFLVVDFATDLSIAEHEPDLLVEPASLTKLMTAYVVFKALRGGLIDLDERVRISEKAWRMRGSRTFLEVDTDVAVGDLLKGLIVQSGNDAGVALAEHLAGSEEAFTALMNQYAGLLGMENTTYRNATGLPAKEHFSTARDTATLARAIIEEFPEYYGLYAQREFTYNNIRQNNRNRLLWRDSSVDGLKTGYTSSAGYCLVSSAEREGMRLIAVVMGTKTSRARNEGSQALLDYGFENFETRKLFSRGDSLSEVRVWKGAAEKVSLGVPRDIFVTTPRGRYDSLVANATIPQTIVAPLEALENVGTLDVQLDGETLLTIPLVVLDAVREAGVLTRIRDEIELLLE